MVDDIKKTLWAAADKLRANMDAAEYKHLVLGLIFLKYISDTFAGRQAELLKRFADPKDEYHFSNASAEDLATELEDRDYYTAANIFWVPEAARWEALRAAAKQPDIGKRIDDALTAIETENPKLKGILDKRYGRAQLPDGKLGELVDLISTIGFGEDASIARDILGQVYEPTQLGEQMAKGAELDALIRDGDNAISRPLPFNIIFADKKTNRAGLQLADLVARPIGLIYIRPAQKNQTFERLKPKFFCSGGRACVGRDYQGAGLLFHPPKKRLSSVLCGKVCT
ncbi:hypothetical protein CCAE64S_01455 [Castellaniella caeni]